MQNLEKRKTVLSLQKIHKSGIPFLRVINFAR